MKRKKLPYAIRLIRVSLKWTWYAIIMIIKETVSGSVQKRKTDGHTGNVPGMR
jgi:hypothetical protein